MAGFFAQVENARRFIVYEHPAAHTFIKWKPVPEVASIRGRDDLEFLFAREQKLTSRVFGKKRLYPVENKLKKWLNFCLLPSKIPVDRVKRGGHDLHSAKKIKGFSYHRRGLDGTCGPRHFAKKLEDSIDHPRRSLDNCGPRVGVDSSQDRSLRMTAETSVLPSAQRPGTMLPV